MRRICLYSDDSQSPYHMGLFHFVVAGVALDGEKKPVRETLLRAEDTSGKGTTDWNKTTDPLVRLDYIESVLGIECLRGRAFYRSHDAISPKKYWPARIATVVEAIKAFGEGYCRFEIAHEGLTVENRERLKRELRRLNLRRLETVTGKMMHKPEIRVADALAGYVRSKLFGGTAAIALPDIPRWFIKL